MYFLVAIVNDGSGTLRGGCYRHNGKEPGTELAAGRELARTCSHSHSRQSSHHHQLPGEQDTHKLRELEEEEVVLRQPAWRGTGPSSAAAAYSGAGGLLRGEVRALPAYILVEPWVVLPAGLACSSADLGDSFVGREAAAPGGNTPNTAETAAALVVLLEDSSSPAVAGA